MPEMTSKKGFRRMSDLIPAISLKVRGIQEILHERGLREGKELYLAGGSWYFTRGTKEVAREQTKHFKHVKLGKKKQIRTGNNCKEPAWRCQ